MATTETETWQSAVKELAAAQKELSDQVKGLASLLGAVRAQSASSSQSLGREAEALPLGNAYSDANPDPTKRKMTFEEFANEAGLTF